MSALGDFLGALAGPARRPHDHGARPRGRRWVWDCPYCDLTSVECGSKAEADWLGRQHDALHHGPVTGAASAVAQRTGGLLSSFFSSPLPHQNRKAKR